MSRVYVNSVKCLVHAGVFNNRHSQTNASMDNSGFGAL